MPDKHRLLELLNRLIHRGTQQQFTLLFHKYHDADIAEAVESLSSDMKQLFFSRLTLRKSVDVFEELDMASQLDIIQGFKSENAADLIEKMDKDDAVDLLEALLNEDKDTANDILNKMATEDHAQLTQLLRYPEDSAGALMTTDFVSIPENLRVKDALQQYQRLAPKESDAAFYLFIVNGFNQIQGVISIRKLLLASAEQSVRDIRNDYPIKVHVHDDPEVVAQLFQKYRSIVLPVVDDLGVILGVITIDDVVNVVVEEATEDMLKLSGTLGEDIQNEKLIEGALWYPLLYRLPWLFVTILGGIIASGIMLRYSTQLSQYPVSLPFVLSFVPLLMGLGGNIGNQSATILVRALAVKPMDRSQRVWVIGRELGVGCVIGGVIAGVVAMYVYGVSNDLIMTLCLAISIVLNMGLASLLGASLPILLKACRIDPAIASAPFISTTLDIIGQLIYFTTIIMLFAWVL